MKLERINKRPPRLRADKFFKGKKGEGKFRLLLKMNYKFKLKGMNRQILRRFPKELTLGKGEKYIKKTWYGATKLT